MKHALMPSRRVCLWVLLAIGLAYEGGYLTHSQVLSWLALPLLLLIPGYIVLACMSERFTFAIRLLLAICLSITFCYVLGVLANEVGLLSGVRSPLRGWTPQLFLILAYVSLVGLWYRRSRSVRLSIASTPPDTHGFLLLSVPLLTVLLAICGSQILNNNGSSAVSFIAYVFIALHPLILLSRRMKNYENLHLPILWLLAVALLMSSALRSHYLSGADINQEYQVARLIQSSGFWSIHLYDNLYNACLSVSMLPVIVSNLTRIPLALVVKVVMPLLFSASVVPVYEISQHILKSKRLSFYATFFFVAQPAFFTTYQLPVRQEMALLLFAAGLLVFAINVQSSRVKVLLFVILNVAMIVSHYSTAYMSLVLYILYIVLSKVALRKYRPQELGGHDTGVISGRIVLMLLIVTVLWYSQVSVGLSSLTSYVSTSVRNIPSLFSKDSQVAGESPISQFNPFAASETTATVDKYVKLVRSDPKALLPRPSRALSLPSYVSESTLGLFGVGREFVKDLGKLAMIVGAVIMYVKVRHWRKLFSSMELMAMASAILIAIVTIMPLSSIAYDFSRAYQQILIVGASLVVCGFLVLQPLVKRASPVIAIFLGVYLLSLVSIFTVFTGGPDGNLLLQNSGVQYATLYAHSSDVLAGTWLYAAAGQSSIYADNYASTKLKLADGSSPTDSVDTNVFSIPSATQAYYYADWLNTAKHVAAVSYEGTQLIFEFPSRYLEESKNLIYTNGTGRVYK